MTRKPKRRMVEFSKHVIVAMVLLWFVVAVFAMVVVIVQLVRNDSMIAINDLLTYIGAPVVGTLIGYMAKSAFENREKIKQAYDPNYDNRVE